MEELGLGRGASCDGMVRDRRVWEWDVLFATLFWGISLQHHGWDILALCDKQAAV